MRAPMAIKTLVLAGGLACGVALADGGATFRGTLTVPPVCSISNGQQVDVPFGDRVGINKVNGVNYRVPVNYRVTCEGGDPGSWAMSLSLSGTATGFDGQALQTDRADLGIRVYQNDSPFMPNSTLSIDPAKPPVLEAVPVKRAGSVLKEGAFEAWATLQADYQ